MKNFQPNDEGKSLDTRVSKTLRNSLVNGKEKLKRVNRNEIK